MGIRKVLRGREGEERMKKETIISILIFAVPISIVLFLVWFLTPARPPVVVQLAANSPITVSVSTNLAKQWESGIYIDNNECFIRIQSGDTVPLDNYFTNNRLRIIIDGESYWIRLEEDINYRFKGTPTKIKVTP